MRYVADDGTEFENEKECLEYESLQFDIENSFIMYDENLTSSHPTRQTVVFMSMF